MVFEILLFFQFYVFQLIFMDVLLLKKKGSKLENQFL